MHHVRNLLSIGLVPAVYAACECGYKTNTGDVFQYAITTDFSDIDIASFRNSSDWNIRSIVFGSSASRPYAANYTTSNVDISNGSLLLTCSAYDSASQSVPSAEIGTNRSDILHGSFRATYKVVQKNSGGAGAVSGFFFYANDNQEVDIELLTREDARSVTFTNQPDATKDMYLPNQLRHSDLNDYRFDWTADNTKFYVNNVLSDTKTTDIPTKNGSLMLNMWGGSTFAGNPPPSSDVTMSVSTIHLYFNTSAAHLSKNWAKTCAKNKNAICNVDSQGLQSNTTSTATIPSTTLSSLGRPRRGGQGGKKFGHHFKWAAAAGATLANIDG